MLNWANQFNIFLLLPANGYNKQGLHQFDILLAAGAKHYFSAKQNENAVLYNWEQFLNHHQKQFIFGHLNYDLKNHIESLLNSNNKEAIDNGFETLGWFVPQIAIMVKDDIIYINADGNEAQVLQNILNTKIEAASPIPKINIKPSQSKAEYIKAIEALKNQIQIGNCYEVNYCQHFYGQNKNLNPINTFLALNMLSPNPFAACYKNNQNWLLCASPERFLSISDGMLYSQPIKGTSKRILNNALADEEAKLKLQNHFKERAENIMVVDLVRNDMSRICNAGSVIVDELCAIYSYPHVHQMISSIKGKLKNEVAFVDIIKALFPMGSMTGAPKFKVMQLIEAYETNKRGLFSGSIGFISPNGNADFNVVIRSLFYNTENYNLSFFTGGGITHYSNAEAEYEESMLKAEAMMELFN